LQNTEHNAVEWLCKPLVSVTNFFSATDAKVLMLGLDGSGKTSILYKLVRDEKVRTEHTIGFNTENLDYKGYIFELWDLEHKPKSTLVCALDPKVLFGLCSRSQTKKYFGILENLFHGSKRNNICG